MIYKVPIHIDSNKVFLINHSDIEGRIDPIFYGSDISRFIKETSSVKLSTVCLNFKSGFGAGKEEQTSEENGIIQIRPTNIDNYGFLKFDKNVYVPKNEKLDFLEQGTVLFNNTNSQELVGKTALLRDEKKLYCSNHITAITVDKNKILPEYLWIILNLYQQHKIFFSICTNWNNQSGVGIDLLKSIRIPIFSINRQNQIITRYLSAFEMKQSKDKEAQNLLDSIDDYLLEELGIKLPDSTQSNKANIPEWMNPENLLVKNGRLFLTEFSSIEGGRFDATFSKYNFSLNSTKYDSIPFSLHIKINPRWDKIPIEDTVVSFIPMEAVNEIYCSITTKFEKLAFESKGYTQFIENDILWAKITPCMQNGKATIASGMINGLGFGSTEFHVFRINYSKLNAQFVLALLHLKCLRTNAMLFFGGAAGQQRVGIDFFKNLFIPFPPLEIQEKIAKEITYLQIQAQKLREEALSSLRHAKAEIEQMILGE